MLETAAQAFNTEETATHFSEHLPNRCLRGRCREQVLASTGAFLSTAMGKALAKTSRASHSSATNEAGKAYAEREERWWKTSLQSSGCTLDWVALHVSLAVKEPLMHPMHLLEVRSRQFFEVKRNAYRSNVAYRVETPSSDLVRGEAEKFTMESTSRLQSSSFLP